jgi:hypothetical protein
MSVEVNQTKTRATMVVGDDKLALSLCQSSKPGNSWFFDTKSGRR